MIIPKPPAANLPPLVCRDYLLNHYIYLEYFIAINVKISYNKHKIKANNISPVKVSLKRLS